MNRRIVDLFQRTTSSKSFIPEIDGFRFIAIATVVIFHFHFLLAKELGDQVILPQDDGGFFQAGWWLVRMDLGVKVFFGISGFILSIPFLKQYWFSGRKVDIKQYFIRRLTRLEPPFLVAISGFLLVHWIILGEKLGDLMPHFFATIFYVHTLIYNSYSTILPVTWSLETEVQFYLIIPVLAFLILGIRSRWSSGLIGLALFFGSIIFRGYLLRVGIYGLLASLPAFLSHFLVGIAFAYLFIKHEKWLRAKSYLWDLVAVLSFLGMFWFYKPQAEFVGQVFFNISIFFLFVSGFKGNIFNYFLSIPVIYLIGGMCYTLYLIHLPLFGLYVKFFKIWVLSDSYGLSFFIHFPIALILLLAVSGAFYLAIEKPCMDKNWHMSLAKKLGIIPIN